jgi:hypothetical protein
MKAPSREDPMKLYTTACLLAPLALLSPGAQAQTAPGGANMTFFVTSVGSGKGADLGGLEGADRHCQTLAAAAGSTRQWRAYLSTQGQGAVNARDRIGRGPWRNSRGEVIAKDVEELHGTNNLTKQTALTEKGEVVKGRGDTPNQHDLLTGSQADGRAFTGGEDMTCGNWTLSGQEGGAMLGHHDRIGPTEEAWAKSWNSSHRSRGGCSQEALRGTGGAGLFMCFATN